MDGIKLKIIAEYGKINQLWKCKHCNALKVQEKQSIKDTPIQPCNCDDNILTEHEKIEIELIEELK